MTEQNLTAVETSETDDTQGHIRLRRDADQRGDTLGETKLGDSKSRRRRDADQGDDQDDTAGHIIRS